MIKFHFCQATFRIMRRTTIDRQWFLSVSKPSLHGVTIIIFGILFWIVAAPRVRTLHLGSRCKMYVSYNLLLTMPPKHCCKWFFQFVWVGHQSGVLFQGTLFGVSFTLSR